MTFDLRGALLRKEERETARLADFEFRLRARTMRLLAPLVAPDLEPAGLVREIARDGDEAILARLAARFPAIAEDLRPLYERSRAEARRQLIDELGDPAPHRLA